LWHDFEVMRLVLLVTALSVVASCRKEPRREAGPEGPRASGLGARVGSAGGSAVAAVAAAVDPDAVPAGTDELVAVPSDVAGKVKLELVAKNLHRPVGLYTPPGDKRMFVLEEHKGTIRVLVNGAVAPKVFLKLTDLSNGNEEGLLGLAFHPKFAENGRFFVDYTSGDMNTHIVEYKVSASDPDVADPKPVREIANILQPFSNHNGGNLVFGPDGKLWVGTGDGGSANDPHKNGQNPSAVLGKMLRYDVDAPGDIKPEILYIGLRNPWRYEFDPKTHDLFIADVGQNVFEEVDVVPAADIDKPHNFGWNRMEGLHCFDPTGTDDDSCDKSGLTLPVVEYKHDQGCSITGGVVYRGKALPRLVGRYFYGDHCTGLLRSFVFTHGVVREHWDWKAAVDPDGLLQQVTAFGTDADGEMYMATLSGEIYRLSPN
jgi:glucose/arabinose dehydrogenase